MLLKMAELTKEVATMERIRKAKVLVVDDEKTVCESVNKILTRLGMQVEEANSAREALEKLEAAPEAFGTALVDLVMPQINGVQLLKVIKARYPALPVVIITGYASIDSSVETTKLGAFEYVPKPFTPQELSDVTERAIKRHFEEQKKSLSEVKKEGKKESKPKSHRPLDVDLPFDEEELRKYTSEQYVESIGRSDIPAIQVHTDFCPVGERRCARYLRVGVCKEGCPLLMKEAKGKVVASAEELLKAAAVNEDILDVDLPFKPSELIAATSSEYVYALTRTGIPLAAKWGEGVPVEKRVLVVDDEPVVCQSVQRILSPRGFHVDLSLGGTEALKQMEYAAYDLVLLDLRMPDMNGMQVLQAIKERWPEVKVIIITGYASIDSAVESIRNGAEEYLPKPFTPSELVAAAVEAVAA
jgi:DNA-binding response OmpR family regulator